MCKYCNLIFVEWRSTEQVKEFFFQWQCPFFFTSQVNILLHWGKNIKAMRRWKTLSETLTTVTTVNVQPGGCGLFNHVPGTNTEKYHQHKHLTTNRTTRPFLPQTDISPHQAGSQGLRSAENSRAKTVHKLTPCWSKNTLSPRRPLGKAVNDYVTILILQFIL